MKALNALYVLFALYALYALYALFALYAFPHSPFPIPHSSFLIPHSSFLIPHSSFLILLSLFYFKALSGRTLSDNIRKTYNFTWRQKPFDSKLAQVFQVPSVSSFFLRKYIFN